MAIQNVFIIGATGNIGSELVRQILEKDSPQLGEHKNPTRIVGVANSKGYLFNPGGITMLHDIPESQLNQDNFKTYLKDLLEPEILRKENGLSDLLTETNKAGMDGELIFVDTTDGNEELFKFHRQVITNSNDNIVTANKNPLALYDPESFKELTQFRERYGMRSTVMAGAHTVNLLFDFYDISEHVVRIEGCFSGSLGYICSELEKDKPETFSEIVKKAHQLKYTEPNPLDDLSGLDVARKLTIIARCLNKPINLKDDIELKGFIDTDKYKNKSKEDFLLAIQDENDEVAKKFSDAKKANRTLRYIASLEVEGETSKLKVGLTEVASDSVLGSLKGTANKISIETKVFTKGKEYIIQSPGAGIEITATGIRRDLLSMLKDRKSGTYPL
jgi:homoserine dehydrogenase